MLRIVVLRCPTLYLRWTASGTCCATLLQRCKQAAWRHLEAANCHVSRHRWKTLDSGLATLDSVWTTLCNVGESITLLDHVVQRCAALHNLWQRCIIAGERWTAFVQRCYNVAKKLPNVISYAGTKHQNWSIQKTKIKCYYGVRYPWYEWFWGFWIAIFPYDIVMETKIG